MSIPPIGDLEHTLQLAPKLPAVSEALFFAALATGDTAKASDVLDQIRKAQGETEIVGNLEGLFQLAQIDFDGAKKTFSDLVQKYPDFAPAKVNLARVDMMQGDKDGAEKILTDVLARQPTAEPALTMLANTYVSANHLDQAVALVERAHAPNRTCFASRSRWAICISGPASRRRRWTWRRTKKAPTPPAPICCR